MENHSEGDPRSADEALTAFFGSFGELDEFAKIVLEEFMEILLDEKK